MVAVNPISKAFLIFKELGPAQLAENLLYRMQVRSGWLERKTPTDPNSSTFPRGIFTVPSLFTFERINDQRQRNLYIKQADEISGGQYHPFGGALEKLDLSMSQPLRHWTKYSDTLDGKDIKVIWEPARFTWAIPLCAAYTSTKDEKYPATFWRYLELFLENNPVNQGPNWSSAQEVALRLIPWVMAGQVFKTSKSSTPERVELLARATWEHCNRIPVSLHYARSQHNNHLLSEALGLMMGGMAFQSTTEGQGWLKLGNREFQKGILSLVEMDGTFSQHSTNYHRMLLHLALVYQRVTTLAGIDIPEDIEERLAFATKWLAGHVDPLSGRAANLGHNDGTNLLPIGSMDYTDYRPTLQAASCAFLGSPCLPQGDWDGLALALQIPNPPRTATPLLNLTTSAIHRIGSEATWASLRVGHFNSRPAHADQLHVEIWNKGINLASDAGTYAYNLPPPWDNSLGSTVVHNTVIVDNQNQMFHASKFLWLKRANARVISKSESQMTARIRANSLRAYTHTRQLRQVSNQSFEILDEIVLARHREDNLPVTIHWLMPDWQWKINGDSISIKNGNSSLLLQVTAILPGAVSLVRAGECLVGSESDPIRGWFSATYLNKTPALSYAVQYAIEKRIQIKSLWTLDRN